MSPSRNADCGSRIATSNPRLAIRNPIRNPKSAIEGGGSAWESNPASPRERGATDFEDREGRRTPFTSTRSVMRFPPCGGISPFRNLIRSPHSEIRNDSQDLLRIAKVLQHHVGAGLAELVDAMTAGRDR